MSNSNKSKKAIAPSVTDMLREDHNKVKSLFDEFEQTNDVRVKQRIANTAMTEMEIHSMLEEELIYPAIRSEIDDDDLMDEALEEHHVVYVLIEELKTMKQQDAHYDEKFAELAENVKQHIQKEESKILPKAEDSEIDWETLSSQARKQKEQLLIKRGVTTSKANPHMTSNRN